MGGRGKDNDELLPAKPGHDVVSPGFALEDLGDGQENPVAHRVAVIVVDLREVVDVYKKNGALALARLLGLEALCDPHLETASVDDPCQGVD